MGEKDHLLVLLTKKYMMLNINIEMLSIFIKITLPDFP
jgi:hypothetical protein